MELENKTPWWLKAVQSGLIGGVVIILSALVGMVESFHARDIIAGKISMGETLLLLIIVLFAYSSSNKSNSLTNRVLSGVITAVVASAVLVAFIMFGKAVNMRSVLVNASPALYKILTFEMKSIGTAYATILGIGTLTGLVVSLIHTIPDIWRKAVMSGFGIMLLIALLQDLLRITLTPFPTVTEALAWMFGARGQEGLSVVGAVVVFVVVFVGSYLSSTRGDSIRARTAALPASTQKA